MNETIKTIMNRRSIRSFLPEQIKEGELKDILEAGLYAPSAINEQPWHFTVIQNKELIERLNVDVKKSCLDCRVKYLEGIVRREGYHIFHHSPTIVIVSGYEKAGFHETDCAAATENMLLAAESLGIGSCWIGLARFLFGSEKSVDYLKELGIPEGFKPLYAVALGYKREKTAAAPPRRENTVRFIK